MLRDACSQSFAGYWHTTGQLCQLFERLCNPFQRVCNPPALVLYAFERKYFELRHHVLSHPPVRRLRALWDRLRPHPCIALHAACRLSCAFTALSIAPMMDAAAFCSLTISAMYCSSVMVCAQPAIYPKDVASVSTP